MKTSLLILAFLGGGLATTSLIAQPADRPDPETVVVDLFEFDADESDSLNAEELVTGFRELRKKHRGANGPREGRRGGPRMDGEKDGEGPMGPPPGGKKGKKGKRRGPPSGKEMGTRLIEEFDASGDGELDAEELLNAVTTMHERRGPGRRGPAPDETTE